MNFFDRIDEFYKNIKPDNLIYTTLPAICAIVLSLNIFNFNILNGFLILAACILLQISAQIFDDYIDWIFLNPYKRIELEKTGIRGLYTKCSHFLADKKLPRLYFYVALTAFLTALLTFICVCYTSKNYKTLLFLIPVILCFFINYHPKYDRLLKHIGTEFLCAMLCSFFTFICVFYTSSRCITAPSIYAALIFFFFTYNILYTASLLNIKSDIMTGKYTLPIIIKNENIQFLFSIFLTIFPFILLPVGVYLKILPKISLLAEVLIFLAIWFSYLIFLFIKKPQQIIKWHFLMGLNDNGLYNEHNNISWYTIRHNLIKNIYTVFSFIIIISILFFK